ncbi:MAG: hypothetical protein ABI640_02545 [Gammaproteobacteria bacterium]
MDNDFNEANLDRSRNLFTPESLAARSPRPKQLEVLALLSGLPFRAEFTDKLVEVQRAISGVLGERLHYWVAPENLGVEYCVFKWPTGTWDAAWSDAVKEVLVSTREPSFRFDIGGVQVNPDGCVVARGFDEGSVLFRIRARMRANIAFLPTNQSGWAHVPLGRILEPLGAEKFANLARLVATLSDRPIASTQIRSLKFIHETRWYMEEKAVLAEYPLERVSTDRARS